MEVEASLVDAVQKLMVHDINNETLEVALQQLKQKKLFDTIGIELHDTRIQKIVLPAALGEATQQQVTEKHRAAAEQVRMEAEHRLEKQRLTDQMEKREMLMKLNLIETNGQLELNRLKAHSRIELERLKQEKEDLESEALRIRLGKLQKDGLLDTYVEMDRNSKWSEGLQRLQGTVVFPTKTPMHISLPPRKPDPLDVY